MLEQPRGVKRLIELGSEKLERVARAGNADYMGIQVMEFVAAMRAFAASEPEDVEARPRLELDL